MAHFGNWELCGAALSWLGLPFSALVRDLRSQTLNRLLTAQRHAAGIRTISRDRSLRSAVRTLKENGVLAILADIDTAVEGRFVEFFGRPAYTPVGPVVLSQRYGSPTVPVFLRRTEGPYHRLEIGPPIEWAASSDSESALVENVARFTRIIEDRIRSAPEQWVWMHPRWRTQPG